MIIAIKYTIVERPQHIDSYVKPCISSFLILIKDADRHVRKAAVSALSTAAHNKPAMVKELLPTLLPLLYDQTVVKKEQIGTIDLRPFKLIVDDGLELRKGAFECVDTLLDSCLDKIDPSVFITPHPLSGLAGWCPGKCN